MQRHARPLRVPLTTGKEQGAVRGGRSLTPWASGEAPAVGELFVGGEGLREGPVDVLGTLLHEAAHGVALTRRIKDTSRAGAYHNRRYATLAGELGLEVEQDPRIGWSLTIVPEATAAAYAGQVDQLGAAIAHIRDREPARRGGGGRSAPTYLCGCEPPRRLRIAPGVHALAPVLCGGGGEPFA